MINVYLDPSSTAYLSNNLFNKNTIYNRDNCLLVWRYLRNYCQKKNISLNTVDFWSKSRKTSEDIYVALDYKNFARKFFQRFKNKKYPIVDLNNFRKKILFQYELPLVTPEAYLNIDGLLRVYDKIFFSSKLDNPRCDYFSIPRIYNRILSEYWNNSNRKFLTMINSNKRFPFYRRFYYFFQKNKWRRELLSERIKIINFFSRNKEIDLYGLNWGHSPFFPYWLYKNSIQKVYKGPVKSKYQKLSEYNFAIAFDNSTALGFIGHGIFDCFFVGTVPIYLGAPDIEEYIPKNCFIDMRDFKDYAELREFLKSLPEEKIKEYRENARQFLQSEKYKPFTKEYFAELFVKAVIN